MAGGYLRRWGGTDMTRSQCTNEGSPERVVLLIDGDQSGGRDRDVTAREAQQRNGRSSRVRILKRFGSTEDECLNV